MRLKFLKRLVKKRRAESSETSFTDPSASASSASSQLSPSPTVPVSSSNLPKQQTHHLQREYKQDEDGASDLQKTPNVPGEPGPVYGIVGDEYQGYGSEAASTGRSEPGGADVSRESLWDRAYKSLDEEMRTRYELLVDILVKGEDYTTSNEQDTEAIHTPGIANPRILVDEITRRGQDNLAKKRHDRIIGLNPRDVLDKFTEVTSFVKPLVDEAVKASPEASLAWVGVCIILPIFTKPHESEKANVDGLEHISSHMPYYTTLQVALQEINFKEQEQETVEEDIVQLYASVLDFQCRSALRFYRQRFKRFMKDWLGSEQWDSMLSKIKEDEETQKRHVKLINSTKVVRSLELSRDINAKLLSISRQQLQVLEKTHEITIRAHNREYIEKRVPMVPGANYKSREDEHYPQCHKDTRVGILRCIKEWWKDCNSEPILWLYGPAGFGKSTISRTVAERLEEDEMLAASYFFKRNGRSSATNFFSTISRQLVDSIKLFDNSLINSLNKMSAPSVVTDLALKEQFERLIANPLSEMRPAASEGDIPTKVVVIDGMDECDTNDIQQLCELLSKLSNVKTIRLLVLLTSRETHPTTAFFEKLACQQYRRLPLVNFESETKDDISRFLEEEFAMIKRNNKITKDPWPEPGTLNRLIALSTDPSPLFIYATTLCAYVDDGRRRGSPSRRLDQWLKDCDTHKSQLDQMYTLIARQVFLDENGNEVLLENEKEDYLKVLGAIVLLVRPLSRPALGKLLDMENDDLNNILSQFSAILTLPERSDAPVEIFHTSFSDFMLAPTPRTPPWFRVDREKTHEMLALDCIKCMERTSRPYTDREYFAQKSNPSDFEYARQFWADHWLKSGMKGEEQKVYHFLSNHFLHWVGAFPHEYTVTYEHITGTIKKLASRAKERSSDNTQYMEFLKDAENFLRAQKDVISSSPRDIHSTALVFSPDHSIIRQNYWKQRFNLIESSTGIRGDWDLFNPPMRHSTRKHPESFAFSTDGEALVMHSLYVSSDGRAPATLEKGVKPLFRSSSYDYTVMKCTINEKHPYVIAFALDDQICVVSSKNIQLWEHSSQRWIKTDTKFEISTQCMSAVLIPGSNNIAVSSVDGAVYIINAKDGRLLFKIEDSEDCEDRRSRLAVSPDGRLIGVVNNENVRLFDSKEGRLIGTLQNHSSRVHEISFRQGDNVVASASADGTIRLWDTSTCLETLKIHGETAFSSLAFSPDGMLLAAISNHRRLWLWDVGNLRLAAEGNTIPLNKAKIIANWTSTREYDISSFAFSPDSQYLAWLSRDRYLDIWSTSNSNSNLDEPVSHCICSSDGSLVVSTSYNIIKLWDSNSDKPFDRVELESEVYAIALSLDGILAIGQEDTVSLWIVETEVPLSKWKSEKLEIPKADDSGRPPTAQSYGMIRALAFSPKGDTIAAGFDDGSLHLWDVKSRAHTQTLYHNTSVFALTFSPDGKVLVSGTKKTSRSLLNIRNLDGGLWNDEPADVADCPTKSLSFWPSGRYIDTGQYLFNMETLTTDDYNQHSEGEIYCYSSRYIVRDDWLLLYVHPNFRYLTFARNMAVLGHRTTGQLIFVRFNLDYLNHCDISYRIKELGMYGPTFFKRSESTEVPFQSIEANSDYSQRELFT